MQEQEYTVDEQPTSDDLIEVGEDTRVVIYIGDKKAVHIFPAENDDGFQKEIRRLMATRFETKRNKFKDNSVAAAERFYNTVCLGVEGYAHHGSPITQNTPRWKDLIPVRHKYSVAMYFMEQAAEEEEEIDRD